MSNTVGSLQEAIEEMSVVWRIPDFFSLPDEVNSRYCSTAFQFLGKSWYLGMCPKEEGWIGVHLYSKTICIPLTVAFSISLNTVDGKKYNEFNFTHFFGKSTGYGSRALVRRSQLIEKKDMLVPSDVLTIFCSVKKHVPGSVSRTEKISGDFKSLLETGRESDLTVRVEALEFRLHKTVLEARSPHLLAACSQETEDENEEAEVKIDCRADVFRLFTRYLYTGKVEELCADNVIDLYKLADKSLVTELAADCVDYMKDTLTVDTFYDVLEVALKPGKQKLLRAAAGLLSDKMDEITSTEEWQSFLLKNPLQANELFRKAFDVIKNKKCKF